MKLCSAASNYLNAHSSLNIFIFLSINTNNSTNQTLKEHDFWILQEAATYFGSSRKEVFWK